MWGCCSFRKPQLLRKLSYAFELKSGPPMDVISSGSSNTSNYFRKSCRTILRTLLPSLATPIHPKYRLAYMRISCPSVSERSVTVCWNWYCGGAEMIFDAGGWDMECLMHLLHPKQRCCMAVLRLIKKHFSAALDCKHLMQTDKE